MNNIETISILRDFHKITGARISIHDIYLNEIACYPEKLSDFCSAVQRDPKVKQKCMAADQTAFETVRKTGLAFTYKCHCGLIETVAPIYHYGVLSGYFMMGQFIDNAIDSDLSVLKLSKPFFDSEDELFDLVQKIAKCDSNLCDSYVNILKVIAEYMTTTNRIAPRSKDLAVGVKHYINSNLEKDLSIEGLCTLFGCSRSTLITRFKGTYGMTIGTYITDSRLKKSEKLLTETSASIKNIAEICGFKDQNYFSKVFFNCYGKTPSDYRRNLN